MPPVPASGRSVVSGPARWPLVVSGGFSRVVWDRSPVLFFPCGHPLSPARFIKETVFSPVCILGLLIVQ